MFTMGYPQLVRAFNEIQIVDDKVSTVYHYTSPSGFQGIIDNKEIWLSDRGFLNDSSEEVYTLKLLQEAISNNGYCQELKEYVLQKCSEFQKELLNRTQRTYVISFSTSGDSLCLWNYYTKGNSIQGYNVGFNPIELKRVLANAPITKDPIHPISGKVIYKRAEQIDAIKQIIDRLVAAREKLPYSDVGDFIIDKVLVFGYLFKATCFEIEKEYRIVFTWDLNIPREKYKLKDDDFRENNGYFVPYIKLPIDGQCIQSVSISPTIDYKLAKSCVSRMLRKNFPNVVIKKSKIPVRY